MDVKRYISSRDDFELDCVPQGKGTKEVMLFWVQCRLRDYKVSSHRQIQGKHDTFCTLGRYGECVRDEKSSGTASALYL